MNLNFLITRLACDSFRCWIMIMCVVEKEAIM